MQELFFFLLIKKKTYWKGCRLSGLMAGRSDSIQVGGLTFEGSRDAQGQNNFIAMFQTKCIP